MRPAYCFVLGTALRIIDKNSDSLGEIFPKRYTTLSAEKTASMHDKNIITAPTVAARQSPYARDSTVMLLPTKLRPITVTPKWL